MMTLEQLHETLERKLVATPFEPFVINASGGNRYEIVRKFQAALGPTTMAILPPTGDGSRMVRLDEVRSLEPLILR